MTPVLVVEPRPGASLAEPGPSESPAPDPIYVLGRQRARELAWSSYVSLFHPPESGTVVVFAYQVDVGRGDYRTRNAGAKGSEVVDMVRSLKPRFFTLQGFTERAVRKGRTYRDAPSKAEWNLASLGCVWIELDFYKKPRHRHRTAEEMAEMVLERCRERDLPYPSQIVSSGKGVYGIWHHTRLAPYGKYGALGVWKAVQKHLNDHFVDYGRDIAAMSPTTNLRVAGSLNGGRTVRVIWPEYADQIARYDFARLKAEILPYTAEQVRAYRDEKAAKKVERKAAREVRKAADVAAGKPPRSPSRKLTRQTFQRAIMRDLEVLFEARFQGQPVPHGQRDIWLYTLTTAAAWLLEPAALRDEVRRLAPLCGLPERRALSLMGAVLRQADRAAKGITRTHKGRAGCDYRYRTNPRRIVDEFGVTVEEAEELNLRVLVPRALKASRTARRAEAYRRKNGAASRADIQAERLAYGQHALERRAAGVSVDELAFEARAKFGEGKGSKSWVEKAMREARAVVIGKPQAKACSGRPRKASVEVPEAVGKNPFGSSRSIAGLDKEPGAVVACGDPSYDGSVHSVRHTMTDTRAAASPDAAALDVPDGEEPPVLGRFHQRWDGQWFKWWPDQQVHTAVSRGLVEHCLHEEAGAELTRHARWHLHRWPDALCDITGRPRDPIDPPDDWQPA